MCCTSEFTVSVHLQKDCSLILVLEIIFTRKIVLSSEWTQPICSSWAVVGKSDMYRKMIYWKAVEGMLDGGQRWGNEGSDIPYNKMCVLMSNTVRLCREDIREMKRDDDSTDTRNQMKFIQILPYLIFDK